MHKKDLYFKSAYILYLIECAKCSSLSIDEIIGIPEDKLLEMLMNKPASVERLYHYFETKQKDKASVAVICLLEELKVEYRILSDVLQLTAAQ